ncbi:MAG: tetratricopeptide repeat protein [Cytophagaceae bacterium]|nr:tetratricopeptide repeat protein [Cytophagaceae bacterium]
MSSLSMTTMAQDVTPEINSLNQKLAALPPDTNRVIALDALANSYFNRSASLSRQYALEAAILARRLGYQRGEAQAYYRIGTIFRTEGNFPLATQYILKSLKIRETLKYKSDLGQSYLALGHIAWDGEGNNKKAMIYLEKGLALIRAAGDSSALPIAYNHIGLMHKDAGNLKKAISYIRQVANLVEHQPVEKHNLPGAYYNNLSKIALQQKQYQTAFYWVGRAIDINRRFGNLLSLTFSLENAARTHAAVGHRAIADSLFTQSLRLARQLKSDGRVRSIYQSMSETYEWTGDLRQALIFHKKYMIKSDSVLNERTSNWPTCKPSTKPRKKKLTFSNSIYKTPPIGA